MINIQQDLKEGYIRVSEILGWFKANALAKIDPAVLANKADIGTNVHAAISATESGLFVPLNDRETGYYNSYIKWRSSNNFAVFSHESRFYCDKLNITGAIDGIYKDMTNGEIFLIDFKTSVKEDCIGWPLQGAFYWHLSNENGLKLNKRFIFVKLLEDGKGYVQYVYPFTEVLHNNMMRCYHTYKLWNLNKKELEGNLY
jgi:hypothetical protein